MNRPILIVVIGYIIGIIWGIYLKLSIFLFYFFLILIYIVINWPYSKKKFKIFSIKRYFRYLKLIFKIEIIFIIIISSLFSNIIVKFYNKYENLYKGVDKVDIYGIIVSNKMENTYYNKYKIKVYNGKFKKTHLYIQIAINQEFQYGDMIKIEGDFVAPEEARNYRGFDYKQYLKTQKIYGTVKVKKIQLIKKDKANIFAQTSNKIFLKIKDNIKKTYNEEISKIVLGVMLGYTDEIDDKTKQDFSDSNISHVLAVSGLHISYIVILVTNSTKKIFGKRKSKIIACIVLIIYMFITGFSISVVRASIMGILSCCSFIVYRKSDTLNNIAISALVILLENPYSLIGVNFLLTYGGTLGIIYFEKVVEKIIKSVKVKNRKWKYIYLKIQRKCGKIIEIISVSISAQIIIGPIIALKFNSISLSFIITNLLLSSVIGIIVISGFIQILISLISIKVGVLLAKIIEIPFYLIILISKINIGNFKIITPSLYQVISYYIVIFIIRYLYKIFHSKDCTETQKRVKNTIYFVKYKLRLHKFKIIIIVSIIFFLIIFCKNISHQLKIYFIDVGQGDSTLIITPQNKTILIDGGGSETYDVGKNILIPYLLDRKIKKLDYVIITHTDQDHIRTEF